MPSSPGYAKVEKFCIVCDKQLVLNNTRDIGRKLFCSNSCKGNYLSTCGLLEKNCLHCGILFTQTNHSQIYCSTACSNRANSSDTKTQYERISGNWEKYLGRLCNSAGREALDKDTLLQLLAQQKYKCALSGIELTCKLESGTVCPTNASIDRIEVGGPYIKENIRLVCRQANTMRWTLTDDELVWWCKRIINHVSE